MTSKFAGLKDLQNPIKPPEAFTAGQPTAERAGPAPAPHQGPVLATEPPKPTGKRSDPAFKQASVLMRVANTEAAKERLRTKYKGTDFSELMDALLEHWLRLEGAA